MSTVPTNRALKQSAWKARLAKQRKRNQAEGEGPPEYGSLGTLRIPDALQEVDGKVFLLYDSGEAAGNQRLLVFGGAANRPHNDQNSS